LIVLNIPFGDSVAANDGLAVERREPQANKNGAFDMFTPWVGAHWGQADNAVRGRKILILGESHYEDGQDGALVGSIYADGTLETFEEFVLGEKTLPFFTKLLQTISGRKKAAMTRDEIRAIWDSVIFYNYVPVYVARGPRVAPTNEMFEMGALPFKKVINEFSPEVIVVCGYRLWWWLLKGQGFAEDPFTKDTFPIGSAMAMRMRHPSTAFSSEEWHAVLRTHLT
jgi:hypothetical protein